MRWTRLVPDRPTRASRQRVATVKTMTERSVVVLNSSSEPLHLVRLGRAVHLLLGGSADLVRQDGEINAGSRSYPRPTVIRLRRFVHIPWREAPLTPRNLRLRDGGTCQWCRSRAGDTMDHVIPRSRGGAHHWSNVVLACRVCNNRKADQLPRELGWSLTRVPKCPSRRDLTLSDPALRSRLLSA
jgi:5-methylcytosine-specific restriction endonuclease McrA